MCYMYTSSPRPWGCFLVSRSTPKVDGVFPTPVGVFPDYTNRSAYIERLPHARGGVSPVICPTSAAPWSSPRPWGCFPAGLRHGHYLKVFPTPVGVFPYLAASLGTLRRLPHARGGVSRKWITLVEFVGSSPRPWGCFPQIPNGSGVGKVFPTPVGVFPLVKIQTQATTGLPHARGGVSHIKVAMEFAPSSSPRPWGCFFLRSRLCLVVYVFPTPVGVFPLWKSQKALYRRLPHARGGVSNPPDTYDA